MPTCILVKLLLSLWTKERAVSQIGCLTSSKLQSSLLAEEISFLQASGLCDALVHKSACFPFLSIFIISEYLEASLVLLARAVQLLCALAVSVFFFGQPSCQRPSFFLSPLWLRIKLLLDYSGAFSWSFMFSPNVIPAAYCKPLNNVLPVP